MAGVHAGHGVGPADSRSVFFDRHYALCAGAILGVAAFNLTFRLGSEFLTEWDDSLYAISAWEAFRHRSWIGTTFMGELDYYNTKPPLMVWLIALAFKAFGVSLVSARLVSALAAWMTVAVLQYWSKRLFGPIVALLASLVLATMFGFVHVHSGRAASTDAVFTLVMLLTAVTLWAERAHPWTRLWLGALLAAAFLLRGMGGLMPLALVFVVLGLRARSTTILWKPTIGAAALFLVPVMAWGAARYKVDGWMFFERMFMYDFVARTTQPLEQHPGGPLYYLNILQKHHYDWLLAGLVTLLVFPMPRQRLRTLVTNWRHENSPMLVLAVWAAVALIIPTLMQTKTAWYLNPFYPVFATGLGLTLARGFDEAARAPKPGWTLVAHAAVIVLVLGVAEGKLLWYSYHFRDLGLSEQSLLLAEQQRLRGQRVYLFQEGWTRASYFVADAVVGASSKCVADRAHFLRDSRAGDYLLTAHECSPSEQLVRRSGRYVLCRRERDAVAAH